MAALRGKREDHPMCGRYRIKDTDVLTVFLRWTHNIPEWVPDINQPRYNVAPSQTMPVVVMDEEAGTPALKLMRWGLVPFWEKSEKPKIAPINARAEEALAKPMFRQSIQKRRCLIPADGFYEWQVKDGLGKQPYDISLKDGSPFFMAGIYERATEIRPDTYLLFTTTPNELMAPIHNRMPAILTGERSMEWIKPGEMNAEKLAHFTSPYPAEAMAVRPISTLVNSPKNDSSAILSDSMGELF